MKLAIDLDGPVYPFVPAFCDWLEEHDAEWARTLRRSQSGYNLTCPDGAWTPGDMAYHVDWAGEDGVYRRAAPYVEAVKAIDTLIAAGHDVFFATSRPWSETVFEDTAGWVADHFDGLEIYPKAMMPHFDLLLDDNPETCRSVLGGRARFYPHQWNALDFTADLEHRTWRQFLAEVAQPLVEAWREGELRVRTALAGDLEVVSVAERVEGLERRVNDLSSVVLRLVGSSTVE